MALYPSAFGDDKDTLPPTAPPAPAPTALETAVDTGKELMGGVLDLTGQGALLLNPHEGSTQSAIADLMHGAADYIRGKISPENRKAFDASVFPDRSKGEAGIGDRPMASIAGKLAGAAPYIAAGALAPEGMLGAVAGAAGFGMQAVAQQLYDTRNQIAAMSDDELVDKYPLYSQFRNTGFDEATSRRMILDKLNTTGSLATSFAGGAAAGGALGHVLKGGGRGFVRGILKGGGEGAVAGGMMSAAQEFALQQGQVETGERKSYDFSDLPRKAADTAVQFGALGAVAGGASGAITGRADRAAANAKKIREKIAPVGNEPDAAQTAALNTETDDGTSDLEKQANAVPDQVPPTTPPTDATQPASNAPPSPAPTPPPATEGVAPNLTPTLLKSPAERRAELFERAVTGNERKAAADAQAKADAATAKAAERDARVKALRDAATTKRATEIINADGTKEVIPQPEAPPSAAADDVARVAAENTPDANTPAPALPAGVTPEAPRTVPEVKPVTTVEPPKLDKATGRRVLTAKPSAEVVAAKEAATAAAADKTEKTSEAARKRGARVKKVDRGEQGAREIITNQYPTTEEELRTRHAEEDTAMMAVPRTTQDRTARTAARVSMYERAKALLASAKAANVEVPDKSPARKVADTPYLSRLIDTKKFVEQHEAVERYANAKGDAETMRKNKEAETKARAALNERVKDHVTAERALREGDTETAQRIRRERNEAIDSGHEQSRQKRNAEGEVIEHADEHALSPEEELERLQEEQARDEEDYSPSLRRERPEDGAGETEHTTVGDALGKLEGVFSGSASAKISPQRDLYRAITRRLKELVGNVEVHVLSDAEWQDRYAHNPKVANYGEGLYHHNQSNGDGTHYIEIRRSIYDDVAAGPRVLIHEATHAATADALITDPQFRRDIEDMMAFATKSSPAIKSEYGMESAHEFVAEAFGNPVFQRALAKIQIPAGHMRAWGISHGSMWSAFVSRVARMFGFGDRSDVRSLLDAVMSKTDRIMEATANMQAGRTVGERGMSASISIPPQVREAVGERVGSPATWKNTLHRLGMKMETFTQLAENATKYFGSTPRMLAEVKARMATMKDKIMSGDEKLIYKLSAMERAFSTAGTGPDGKTTMWEHFTRMLHDETVSGGFWGGESNAHLGKDAMSGYQAKAQLVEGAKRFNALPPELKALRSELHKYFKARQDAMSLGLIRNIIRAVNGGKNYEALAQWIHGGRDDKDLMASKFEELLKDNRTLSAITKAKNLSKIAGPYVPLMRHGDHVVTGMHQVVTPAGAERYDDAGKKNAAGNVFEFKDKAQFKKFVETTPYKVLDAGMVHTDEEGNTHVLDENDKRYKLKAEDIQSEKRYRAELQLKHVEFHEGEYAARKARDALAASGLDMKGVEMRKFEPEGRNTDYMSAQLDNVKNSLEKTGSFKAMDGGARRLLLEQLHQSSLQALGSTRAQSRRLPRTNVAGASMEVTHNAATYAGSTAGYLAKLKFQPDVDKLMKDMRAKAEERSSKDEVTIPRRALLNEIEKRAYSDGDPHTNGVFDNVINRLLQMSFLDKLASPAFHMINATEPWIVGMPYLAGRHNPFRVVREMNRAYNDIGAISAVGRGFVETGTAIKKNTGLTNYVSRFADRLKDPGEKKMLEYMYDTGLMSRDAGMELSRLTHPDSNMLGRALDRADLMARQMGVAIESINRAVLGVTSYRLEKAKGATHEQAVQRAHTTIHDTMGDYSGWNAPPMFKSRLGRLALQFKKYAQKTYYLLGKQIAGSLKGDPEAIRAFTGLMITYGAMAGVLGLPTEGVQVLMLAANLAGVTDTKYSDLERKVRQGMAGLFGNAGGEVVSRGLPHLIGIDVSSRIGLNNILLGMGDLKSTKPDDIYAYFAKMFSGAPASLLVDAVQGVHAIAKGDYVQGARLLMPIKVWDDAINGYQLATQGKKTGSGREAMAPTGVGAGITRAIGFSPASVSEYQEKRYSIMAQQERLKSERGTLVSGWLSAAPAKRQDTKAQIDKWNAGQPQSAKITTGELLRQKAARDRESTKKDYEDGLRTTGRDRFLRDENRFYNTP